MRLERLIIPLSTVKTNFVAIFAFLGTAGACCLEVNGTLLITFKLTIYLFGVLFFFHSISMQNCVAKIVQEHYINTVA